MRNIIRLEEAAMFAISIYAFYVLHAQWWWYVLILFAPDISMIGYLVERHLGAGLYNVFHHKGFALFIFFIGYFTDTTLWELVGILLFGHSSMDRMFGYGLKYSRGFKYTHLGTIGDRKIISQKDYERSKK